VNSFAEGDPRDTTTPAAMATSLQRVVVGKVLQPASRQQLADWLIDNETGDACLRAWASAGGWVTRPAAMAKTRATTSPCCGRMPAAPWVLTAYLQAVDQLRAARRGAGTGGAHGRSADRMR
jgi:beta-lactamase class A